jgi:hypothetical protein
MGLTLVLQRQARGEHKYVHPDERIASRTAIGIQVSRFYEAYFKVNAIEVWKFAPMEENEGILIDSLSIEKKFVTREDHEYLRERMQNRDFPDRLFSIIRLVGAWQVEGHEPFESYLSIANDPNWRRIYGDVELNIIPDGETTDIVEIFYRDKLLKEKLVDRFLASFAGFNDGISRVSNIYFSLGVPSAEDFDLWRTASLQSENELLRDAITAYKTIGGEKVTRRLDPYSLSFIIKSLREIPQFDANLNDFLSKNRISASPVGSIGLIGEEPEAFKKFFADFVEKVLEPVIDKLPPDVSISDIIKNAYQKQKQSTLP